MSDALALPRATFRSRPEDFVVDELPAYRPCGQGEHLYLTFRKVGLTTLDAIGALARALGVDPRGTGFAGMKDRHAVTTQTASFPFPLARAVEADVAAIAVPGVTILEVARHGNKLKPGHLEGNRFTIVLRDLAPADVDVARAALEAAGRAGVPNEFGPQRFGRDGDNPERALAWLAGRERGPRDKRQQRLLFSALQSRWFNQVLARREAEGTWAEILPGDLAKKHDSGGLFPVPLDGPDLDDARARGVAGAISPTGPMFGSKMRWPEGAPRAIEDAVMAEGFGDPAKLEAFRHLGEGTRRSLRLEVSGLAVTPLVDGGGLTVSFVLPKGGYATTVLGRACRLDDASRAPPAGQSASAPGDDPAEATDGDSHGSDDAP